MKPRSVIVSLQSLRDTHAIWSAATELARLFGVSVRGCLFEEPALHELCDLPASFLPRPLLHNARTQRRQTMISAVRRETERIRSSVESFSREARVETELTVLTGRAYEQIGNSAGADDLLVIPLDLSDRPISRQVRQYLKQYPGLGALLFVPDAHPSRAGEVICLTDHPANRAVAVAIRLAKGLHAPIAFAMPAPERGTGRTAAYGGRIAGARQIILPDAVKLDATMASGSGLRLIVCDKSDSDRVELDGRDSALLRTRASLLILCEAGPQQ